MTKRIGLLFLLSSLMLALAACDQISIPRMEIIDPQTDSHNIELGEATTARVEIEMGLGDLVINSGATNLMGAEFTYNVAEWTPEVDYSIIGDEGRLVVRQPSSQISGIPDSRVQNDWIVQLNNQTPINLDVNLGAGRNELNLYGLNLTNLDVEIGAGTSTIDLSGNWSQSVNVDIRGGVGSTTIILPNSPTIGVRVDTQTGIGSIDVYGLIRNGDTYTNQAFATAETILDIDVQGGVGQIKLEVRDAE